jgi:membrane protease YdiL (CAAX protease family)
VAGVGAASLPSVLALAALLLAPAMFRPASRPWAMAFLGTLALGLALPALPLLWPGERPIGHPWNWSGQLLALAGIGAVAGLLVRRGLMSWPEMGFTAAQREGSLWPALAVTGVALSLNHLAMGFSGFRLDGVPLETWAYQATLPGLVEESLFRGLLLALADRAFVARRTVFGAPLGWGGAVVSVLFVALHGWRVGVLLGVLPAALLYLWLRARSGSLVLPIAAHNLWNLSVHAAHL